MALTPTFKIQKSGDNVWLDSLTDYKWAVEDLINIGEPKMEEHFVQIPFGREYDLSTAMFGFPMFTTRDSSFTIGVPLDNALAPNQSWNEYISNIRNLYEGRLIKIRLADDSSWYYEGIAHIEDFEAKRKLGKFKLTLHGDAFKHAMGESVAILSVQSTIQTRTVYLQNSPYPADVQMIFGDVGTAQTFIGDTTMTWKLNGKTFSKFFPASSGLNGDTIPLLLSKSTNYGVEGKIEIRGMWDSPIQFIHRARSL